MEDLNEHPFLHPGRAADVTIDGEKIAYIGQIHPEVMDNYNMKGEVYVAVIDMPTLVPKATFDRKYEGVAKFPAMKRDLSMVMNYSMSTKETRSKKDINP